jgi:hypothetical protein
MAEFAAPLDRKLQVRDAAGAVRLVADDQEVTAVNPLDVEPVGVAARATRQVNSLRDYALKPALGRELEESRAVGAELLTGKDRGRRRAASTYRSQRTIQLRV